MNDYKELVKYLREEADAVQSIAIEFNIPISAENHSREAADAIEQLVKERDAAVADLENLMHTYSGTVCFYCKHYNDRHCDDCVLGNKWQWRGVQEANNGT